MVHFSLAPENQRSTAFRTRLFSDEKQNRRRVLDGTSKAKPHAQIDAARVHPGDSSEVENDHTPSAAVQQQVRGLQCLFKPFPRLCPSAFVSRFMCWRSF